MDYEALLTFATEVGYRLQLSGAETYRIEESVQRLLTAYGAPGGEVFAIPNLLITSLNAPGGRPLTRIRRIQAHGTDIYRLEALNGLCRRLCAEVPPLDQAAAQLEAVCRDETQYHRLTLLAGYAVGAGAFTVFFGGGAMDALCGALCGVVIGLCLFFMDALHSNLFFKTFMGSFASALCAVGLVSVGLGQALDTIIIGALMALVPGLSFTNALRDIIAGDMVSGLSKLAESLLIGVAIALGSGVALWLVGALGGVL